MSRIRMVAKESFRGVVVFLIWLFFCYVCDFSIGFFIGFIGLAAWLWAFRDLERIIPEYSNAILAPIDGEITHIDFTDNKCSISIKVGFFDTGIIRLPAISKDFNVTKKSGLLLSFSDLRHSLNEQIYAKSSLFDITLFPRIFDNTCFYFTSNLRLGNRIGFMKVGELRLDFLRHDIDLKINVGDKIVGGETVIGYINEY